MPLRQPSNPVSALEKEGLKALIRLVDSLFRKRTLGLMLDGFTTTELMRS